VIVRFAAPCRCVRLTSVGRPRMKSRLSWPVRIAACIGALGIAYAVAEDFFPALRPGPSADVVRTCEKFELGMEVARVREVVAKTRLVASEAPDSILVSAGGDCKCALRTTDGRIERSRVVCSHTQRVLFGSGA
jgi:hypothetical protein